MKIEIKDVDLERGTVRLTYGDDRWYFDPATKKENGLPQVIARPSITWIGGYWYKGKDLLRWMVEHNSWEDVENGLAEAGTRGSKVHNAIERFFAGEKVKHDIKLLNPATGLEEEITGEEFFHVKTFTQWWDEFKAQFDSIEILEVEKSHTVQGEEGMARGYGFTVDLVLAGLKDGKRQVVIIDFKTGKSIWKSASIQVSGIKYGLIKEKKIEGIENATLYILQTGYKANKIKKYKLTEMEYRVDRLKTCYAMWADENSEKNPEQEEFPLEFALDLKGVTAPDGTLYVAGGEKGKGVAKS